MKAADYLAEAEQMIGDRGVHALRLAVAELDALRDAARALIEAARNGATVEHDHPGRTPDCPLCAAIDAAEAALEPAARPSSSGAAGR
jgi:hypothetical protein